MMMAHPADPESTEAKPGAANEDAIQENGMYGRKTVVKSVTNIQAGSAEFITLKSGWSASARSFSDPEDMPVYRQGAFLDGPGVGEGSQTRTHR